MSAGNSSNDNPTSPSESSQQSENERPFLENWRKVSFKQWTLPWKYAQVPASPLPIPVWLERFLSLKNGADDTERSLRNGLTYMTGLPHGDKMKVQCQDIVRQIITDKLPAREGAESLVSISGYDPRLNDCYLYGRSCKEFAGDKNSLPSLNDVFDTLLCIPGGGLKNREHPNKISSMVYAFAVLVSLCLERPDKERPELNQTSPFLNLSPLYGLTSDQTSTIRKRDGSGKLIPDRYCEDRTSLIPPATIALLILWNRNHNYIADQLLSIGHWEGVPSDEEQIFELARQVNCKVFRNMILEDFLKGLLGLPVVGGGLGHPEFFKSRKSPNYKSSIEFGLLHHYSTLASEADIAYLHNAVCERSVPNGNGVAETPGPRKGEQGYNNHDLLTILRDATDRVAGAPGARGIATCLKSYQAKIMERAREWNVCSLNEFRVSLGLKPFANFEQWNSDATISKAAEKLYGNIENLELYPGLQAEKSNADSGFALGSTMTCGLLVDIIASLINDPSPVPLSKDEEIASWITQECSPQSDNGAFGAMLPTLLLRHFPEAYPSPNVYALFPLSIPSSTQKILERLQTESRLTYNFDSFLLSNTQYLSSVETMKASFSQPANFTSPYGAQLQLLTGGYGFLLGFDDPKLHDADLNLILLSLFPNKESISQYRRLFRNTIEEKLSRAKSKEIDIVRDVINATCMQWVSKTMCSPLPGKDDKEMYDLLSTMHRFLFRTHKPENGWIAQRDALIASDKMSAHIRKQLRLASLPSTRGVFSRTFSLVRRVATELYSKRTVGQASPSGFLRRMIELSEREGLETVFGNWTAMSDRFSNVIQREFRDLIGVNFDEDSEKLAARIRKEAWDRMSTENIIKRYIRLGFKELVDKKYPLLQAVGGDLDELSEEEFRDLVNGQKGSSDSQARWSLGLCCAKRDLKKSSRRHLLAQRILFENRVREMRLVSNILGLCIMSVTLAQASGQSIMFHLLSPTRTSASKPLFEDKEATKEIIRKSFEFRSPLSVYRIAQDNVELAGGIQIQKGDHLYADVRKVERPQGVGFHKCPAFAFVDEVMPETLQTIFRLEGLGLGNPDRVKKMHNATGTTAGKSALQSLVVTFKSFLPRVVWKGLPPVSDRLKVLQTRVNMVFAFLIIYLLVFGVIYMLLGKLGLPSIQLFPDKSPVNLNCTGRTEVFDPYHDVVFRRGRDGKPIPVEISHKSRKPYRVSVIDVDKKDLRLSMWVDSQLKGMTRDFVLNKSMDCGENLSSCLKSGHSAGMIVVPPGKHTVKLEWAGKEYIPGTQDMDWGGNYTRRFKLQREYCL